MATDERRKSTTDPARTERSNMPVRRGDWLSFWNDPLWAWWRGESPFRRLTREMERWTGDAGFSPAVETLQRRDQFVVRADLPGMKKNDITVQVTDDALTIEGERRSEHEEQREGFYRSERSYGSFCRTVPLPEGAIADSAKASFENGVLEIVMQAPPKEVARGRRLDIKEPTAQAAPASGKKDIYPE